jgi:glycosyltransferase involved in cell wall biosynthesis
MMANCADRHLAQERPYLIFGESEIMKVRFLNILANRAGGRRTPAASMKILVLPRDDNNPYQSLLYREMQNLGVQVKYADSLTESRTTNQLLLPLEMVVRRICGMRLVHIHWTYGFEIYGSYRFAFLRRIAQTWFYFWLWTVRTTGMRLVWTAHNVLPLSPRFTDEVGARRRLVAAADLVIAHSRATLGELAELDIVPRKSVVIPHGPYDIDRELQHLRSPGTTPGPRKLLFFGAVDHYKGVDNLLAAFAELPADLDARLTVVGACSDPSLRASLTDLAGRSPRPITLRFERIAEAEIPELLQDADVMVFPYRQSSTSGSAVLALGHGRPIVVPDLPGLSELPEEAVIRYDKTLQGLTSALSEILLADADVLAKMSATAYAYCASISWRSIARKTFDEMNLIL